MLDLVPVALAATSDSDSSDLAISVLGKVALGVIALVIAFFLATILRNWVKRIIRKKQGEQHEEVQILYGRIAFTGTFAIGAMIALTVIGAPLEWFSGGIGLGVAFAMRSMLANFFAGVVLLSNNKFNMGDFVILDDGETRGKIVDIQSRATTLRAIDGGEITIPNLKMLESNVKCYARNPIRRHEVEMTVGYGSDLKAAAELMKKTVEANENVQPVPAVTVLIKEVADSAVLLRARFWTETSIKWWFVKSDLTRDVFNAFTDAGIDIPYPVQTLRVDDASSDLLAQNSHLLENLQKIESAKHPEKIFQKMPVESTSPQTSNKQ